MLASLDHPNLVRVYDLLEDKKNYYIVSEIVKGGELFEHLSQHKKFQPDYVARIIKQLLLAVNHMHE